jgi:hypothetical protein
MVTRQVSRQTTTSSPADLVVTTAQTGWWPYGRYAAPAVAAAPGPVARQVAVAPTGSPRSLSSCRGGRSPAASALGSPRTSATCGKHFKGRRGDRLSPYAVAGPRPARSSGPQRGVAGLVGTEPSRPQHLSRDRQAPRSWLTACRDRPRGDLAHERFSRSAREHR